MEQDFEKEHLKIQEKAKNDELSKYYLILIRSNTLCFLKFIFYVLKRLYQICADLVRDVRTDFLQAGPIDRAGLL